MRRISDFMSAEEKATMSVEAYNSLRWRRQRLAYKLAKPWTRFLKNAQGRCNNPRHLKYQWYGGKGIKCYLNMADLEFLWFRDSAIQMEHPSIDRKDSNSHYTRDNCQFKELVDNSARR